MAQRIDVGDLPRRAIAAMGWRFQKASNSWFSPIVRVTVDVPGGVPALEYSRLMLAVAELWQAFDGDPGGTLELVRVGNGSKWSEFRKRVTTEVTHNPIATISGMAQTFLAVVALLSPSSADAPPPSHLDAAKSAAVVNYIDARGAILNLGGTINVTVFNAPPPPVQKGRAKKAAAKSAPRPAISAPTPRGARMIDVGEAPPEILKRLREETGDKYKLAPKSRENESGVDKEDK